MPYSEIMMHQVMGGAEVQAIEIDIAARHILKVKERLNQILAKNTGQKIDKVEKDTDRDFFLSPNEAKEYGLIDEVLKGKSK
jgi:ATP-dependent Clp protease protease subunit